MNIEIVTGTKKPSAKSQTAMIAAYLMKGNRLTAMEALQRFACLRLAARIEELRRQGMEIITEMIQVLGGARVAEYSLKRGQV